MEFRSGRLVGVALVLLLAVVPGAAQEVAGRVVDHATAEPLAAARVVLLDPDLDARTETITDARGRFTLRAPGPGSWLIRVELLGYGTVISEPFALPPDGRVELEVRLAVRPIDVEPVLVVSRSAHVSTDIQGFYSRLQRGQETGIGDFITRDEIDRSGAAEPSDLLRRLPGVQVTRGRGRVATRRLITFSRGCVPAIYVDGTRLNGFRISDTLDEFVATSNIEGIEVYRGSGYRFGSYYDERGCGLILVWTRRGRSEGPTFTWARVLIGAALVVGVLLLR